MRLFSKVLAREEEIKPTREVERKKCPFYEFHGAFGGQFNAMMDSEGNQCALTGEYSPCSMEMAQQEVDWDNCTRYNHPNNMETLKGIVSSATAFPKEFHPEGAKSWKGITLKKFFGYIMGKDLE